VSIRLPLPWYIVAICLLGLLRLFLGSGQSLTAASYGMHDDALFVQLASHVAAGRWLGPFSSLTLIKGPGYPLFIAASYVSGVSLMTSQTLLYLGACALTVIALRPLIRSQVFLVVLFALLAFNPAQFHVTRVVREGIYLSLTLLTMACFIGLLARHGHPVRAMVGWATMAGLSLGALWLTREEGLWLLPAIGVLLAATAVVVWRRAGERRWRRLATLTLPIVLWLGLSSAVATTNQLAYGIFATTEMAAPDWLAAYGALTRVEHASFQQYAVVPAETRQRIYAVSPSFASLQASIEGEMGQRWMSHGCAAMPDTCGDVTAGWFLWLLREAVDGAGHYRTGPDAMAFYRQLAAEINSACDAGHLPCQGPRATMAPPWRSQYASLMPQAIIGAATQIIRFEAITPIGGPSNGTEVDMMPFRLITRDRLAPSDRDTGLVITGWGISPTSDITYRAQTPHGTYRDVAVVNVQSDDIHALLRNGGRGDIVAAKDARFRMTTDCPTACRLVAFRRGTDRVLGSVPLDGSVRSVDSSHLLLHIESIAQPNSASSFGNYGIDRVKLHLLTVATWFYGQLGPWLAGSIVLALVIVPTAMLGAGYRSSVLIVIVATALAFAARVGVVAFVDVTSFPSINPQYLGPAHGLLILAGSLAIYEVVRVARHVVGTRAHRVSTRSKQAPAPPSATLGATSTRELLK
jgi:hypothetical protein